MVWFFYSHYGVRSGFTSEWQIKTKTIVCRQCPNIFQCCQKKHFSWNVPFTFQTAVNKLGFVSVLFQIVPADDSLGCYFKMLFSFSVTKFSFVCVWVFVCLCVWECRCIIHTWLCVCVCLIFGVVAMLTGPSVETLKKYRFGRSP